MQKSINIILKAVLTVITAVFATGCMTEKFDTSDGLQSVMLQIDIETGEMTKAAPTAAESEINSIRIYAYRTDGTQVGHFYRASSSTEPIIMDLTLPETGIHDVDFYVFANEQSMGFMDDFAFAEKMSISQLSAAKIHNVTPSKGFPMYRVQSESINVDNVSDIANDATGHEGHFYLTQKVTFKLIRPMAKVSVYAAIVDGGAPGSVSVNKVEFPINGTRNHLYLLPQEDDVLAAIPLRNTAIEMSSQSVTLVKTIDKTDTDAVRDPGNYDLIVADQYLAETEAGDDNWQTKESDRQALLHVEYSIGTGGELLHGYVYLPKIVRNYHYKVCILINSEGNIIINYEVADWDDANLTQLWFDYPTHTYLRAATNETDAPASEAQMSETDPFKGFFKLSYPASEEWMPVLLNAATECEMQIFKVGETLPTAGPIQADSENWYRIEVKPKSGSALTPGDEVELAITYSPDYSTDKYEYLLINGVQNNYHWPYSGTSVQDPNKVIITVK